MMKMILAVTTAVLLGSGLTAATSRTGGEAARSGVSPTRAMREQAPPPWLADDPADSLYRAARQALNGGEYRRAAELFKRIPEVYPKSGYAGDALYWQAFALYKTGDDEDLRAARRALDEQKRRYPKAATAGDATELWTRITGKLAESGDPESRREIQRSASSQPCSGDDDMKAAAMNALQQMDADQALPILKQLLARRDECSVKLRKKAVFLVSQESDGAADILGDVIQHDPDRDVRREAVWWLSQVRGDRAVSLLDSIIRTSHDEGMIDRAVQALSEHDDARAHKILRDLAERNDLPESVRSKAIFSIGNSGHSPEDGVFLRTLYPKLATTRLKEQLLHGISEMGGAENQKWLIDIALDPKEDVEARKKALFWAGEIRGALPELLTAYDRIKEPEVRKQMIFVFSNRNDRAATDKLIEIARKDPDREMRKQAIFWLGQKNDPRVKQLLLEIINQ
ncbi:MAG: HEAT repeat domain-containing protein [Gemmatimonadota bacterium]|nr:HEAT repeat domain-containing protein [Gemmatimonadota bacterium]